MLNYAKCEEIFISEMKLEPGSEMRPFMVSESVELQNVHGDICGFLHNFDVDHMKTDLDLFGIELSLIPHDLLNRFFNSFNGTIRLNHLTGFSSSMLNGIQCKELHLGLFCCAALQLHLTGISSSVLNGINCRYLLSFG